MVPTATPGDPSDATHPRTAQATPAGLSRRGFLSGLGVLSMGTALAACSPLRPTAATAAGTPTAAPRLVADTREVPSTQAQVPGTIIDFDGEHQAGIRTAPQARLCLVAYDLLSAHNSRAGGGEDDGMATSFERLMRIWTADARAMTRGATALADLEGELTADPQSLTITLGIAPRLVARLAQARTTTGGLTPPRWIDKHLEGLPAFSRDELGEDYSGGDLVLQICGNDQTAVAHAARVLTRGGRDYATPRWTQEGFLDSPTGETPRNLLGFKDGTANPSTDEQFDARIWDATGGSAMVVRRIAYDMPNWEALDRGGRETVFGRFIDSGAPLHGTDEFDEVDLAATDSTGLPVIDPNSHVGLAAGEGVNMRRRAYNYNGPVISDADSGLVFICYQNDPDEAFIPLQRKLDANDRLNQWITHIGSALFWCPPGTTDEKDTWASGLLGR